MFLSEFWAEYKCTGQSQYLSQFTKGFSLSVSPGDSCVEEMGEKMAPLRVYLGLALFCVLSVTVTDQLSLVATRKSQHIDVTINRPDLGSNQFKIFILY